MKVNWKKLLIVSVIWGVALGLILTVAKRVFEIEDNIWLNAACGLLFGLTFPFVAKSFNIYSKDK